MYKDLKSLTNFLLDPFIKNEFIEFKNSYFNCRLATQF